MASHMLDEMLHEAAIQSKAVLDKLKAWNHRRRFSHEEVTDLHKILALPTDLADLESYLPMEIMLLGTSSSSSSSFSGSSGSLVHETTQELLDELDQFQSNNNNNNNATTTKNSKKKKNARRIQLAEEINVLTEAMNGAVDELGTIELTTRSSTNANANANANDSDSAKASPVYASAEIPLTLVFVILLIRAYWYYRNYSAKLEDEEARNGGGGGAVKESYQIEELVGEEQAEAEANHRNGNHDDDHNNGDDEYSDELQELELNHHLQTETRAKQALTEENAQLTAALEAHKATVEQFSAELQHRNERLSVFEKEQETVQQDLSAQIQVLQHELKQKQQQQDTSLAHKEGLCNDLVAKIQTLTADLEQHEQLWQGIERKSKTMEDESKSKVDSLQEKLEKEQEERQRQVDQKEKQRAELAAKVQQLEQEEQDSHLEQATQWTSQSQQIERDIEAQLRTEQAHCDKLNTKLKIFTSELSSREERYTALENKTVEFETLSSQELQALQDELQAQLEQRDKLNQTAQEMQQALQEKRDQCQNLKQQLEASRKELKALDGRVQELAQEVTKRETNHADKVKGFQEQLKEEKEQEEAAQNTTDETSALLKQKQFEFVNLTTRMDLFLKELQCRDEKVAELEAKLHDKEELTTAEIASLRVKLGQRVADRDTWNKKTADLHQLMKDKKAQVVGLQTRISLFERELESRQERVAALKAKIQAKEDAAAVKMEPFRKELQRLQAERNDWKSKTDEIDRLLKEKTEQVSGLTTRVKLFRQEVAKRDERVEVLQKTLRSKKDAIRADMSPIHEQLQSQRGQRDSWHSKTAEIDRTLREKQAQCVGLTTRVSLFQRELEKKECSVASLQSMVKDKEEGQGFQITRMKTQLEELTAGLGLWNEKTKEIHQMLADKEKESAKLTTELKSLVGDLHGYHKRRSMLEERLKSKEELLSLRMAALAQERRTAEQHRDQWGCTTTELTRLLKQTEGSIVGLTTRSMLFRKELQRREEDLASLKKQFQQNGEKYSTEVMRLQDELKTQRKENENGIQDTFALNRELKRIKEQCMGLTTRCKLFTTELQTREQLVVDQQAKLDEAEREKASGLEGPRKALQDLQTQRDDWNGKSEDIDRLLQQRETEVVELSSKLELSMTQLQQYEENISDMDHQMKSVRGMYTNQSLLKEQQSLREDRDELTGSTIEIDRLLKERKAEIVGLKTRSKLFKIELARRDQLYKEVEAKYADREEGYDQKIAPIQKTLQSLVDQRDQWRVTTANLHRMLNEKQEECLPVSYKLESAIDRVSQCKERLDSLEEQLRNEEGYASEKMLNLKKMLDEREAEVQRWKESTESVETLLLEKKQGVASLNTRLIVFRNELRVRDNAVKSVETKIIEQGEVFEAQLKSIQCEIEAEQGQRDRIIGATMEKNKILKAIEETCVGLRTRSRLFENELRVREEQVSSLSATLQDKEYIYSAQLKALKEQLTGEQTELEKWKDSTNDLAKLLEERKGECVGLSTRLNLFRMEEDKFNESVALLEAKVNVKEESSSDYIGPLELKLEEEEKERDSWTEKTTELNGMLQEKKTEVVGLSTRSKLFKDELRKKDEHIATVDAKVTKDDEDFASEMEPLRQQLRASQEERDTWQQSTMNVKKLLEQTQKEIASIPVRLDLFVREQRIREDAVVELEAQISEKDNVVAIELGFLLNELQLQQKHRAQWKKTTLDMHRLLKDTKEQCTKFTDKLEACRADLRKRQEFITNLERKIQDSGDLSNTQLETLRNELKVQQGYREKLKASSEELARLLDEGEKESEELSQKLEATYNQTQELSEQVDGLQTKVNDKKENATAQIEQLKEQLDVHLQQRNEWRENTMQMKGELKEKTDLCTRLTAKLDMLKKLQKGETPVSSVKPDDSNVSSNVGQAHEKLTAKMATLENELKVQHKENLDVDRILKEREEQCSSINLKLEALSSELMSL